jgi:sensor c-di-GMP phosphodiesterase-like protein
MNDQNDQTPAPRRPRALWRIALVVLALVALLILTGWIAHEQGVIAEQQALLAAATAQARASQTAQARATATAAAQATATARAAATATAVAKRVFATATAQAQATATAQARQAEATATAQAATANAAATASAAQWQADANATATAQASLPTGLDICTDADYNHSTVQCTSDDSYISALSTAHWVVHGPDGGNFTSGTVTFFIWRENTDGSESQMGSYADNSVDMTGSSESNTLQSLFYDANVTAYNEETYRISAQEPDVTLGSATFTYSGN